MCRIYVFGGVSGLGPSDRSAYVPNKKLTAADGEVDVFDIEDEEWTTVDLGDSTVRPHGIAEKCCVWNDYVSPYTLTD